MTQLIQTILNGVLIGGIYALIAVGLTIIFGVLKIINFAQGEFLMVGMYISYTLYMLFNRSVSSYLLIIPVAVIMFLFGVLIMKLLINPVLGKGDSAYILLTIGLSYLLQNVAQGIWTANFLSINSPIKTSSFLIGDFIIPLAKFIAFCAALALVFLVHIFLKKLDIGRAIRATSESRDIAQLLGINPKRMFTVAFALGVMLAGTAGGLLIPVYSVYPRLGVTFSTIVFAVVVLGGLGNIKGALFSGILVGVVETVVGTYWSVNLAPIVVFVLFIAVMLFKPNGLFSKGGVKL